MVGEGGRNSSGVTKFVVSLCLSSAWRPTGFKPLRVVESTERGREQGGVAARDGVAEEKHAGFTKNVQLQLYL